MYILFFIIGFMMGCMANHNGIRAELRQCRTIGDVICKLEKLRILDRGH